MSKRNFKIYRGDDERGELVNYKCEVTEGMVVLDAILRIQSNQTNDLACRWNCKAGKCGSCSVEINGKPKLACMTRMNEYKEKQTVVITPLKSIPVIINIKKPYAALERLTRQDRDRANLSITPTRDYYYIN